MAIAGFGEIPLVTDESDQQSPWFFNGQNQCKIIKKRFERLPALVKLLFSFNIRQIVCRNFSSVSFFNSTSAEMIYSKQKEKERPFIAIYPLQERMREIYKLLAHELGHSFDPATAAKVGIRPSAHFPRWAIKAANHKQWKKILREEPLSAEESDRFDEYFIDYLREPVEQWASRFAMTLAIDYLVPAGLVSKSNISFCRRTSAERFKSKWPKSYEFFHEYIGKILAHAPKK